MDVAVNVTPSLLPLVSAELMAAATDTAFFNVPFAACTSEAPLDRPKCRTAERFSRWRPIYMRKLRESHICLKMLVPDKQVNNNVKSPESSDGK